jgi:hypothetical protein
MGQFDGWATTSDTTSMPRSAWTTRVSGCEGLLVAQKAGFLLASIGRVVVGPSGDHGRADAADQARSKPRCRTYLPERLHQRDGSLYCGGQRHRLESLEHEPCPARLKVDARTYSLSPVPAATRHSAVIGPYHLARGDRFCDRLALRHRVEGFRTGRALEVRICPNAHAVSDVAEGSE